MRKTGRNAAMNRRAQDYRERIAQITIAIKSSKMKQA